jgi:fructokinase
VLWDALPLGLFLGGAPFNVGTHLQRLGVPAAVVSRVGDDRLGAEARRRIAAGGVAGDLLQTDPHRPTGFVEVEVDAAGIPTYRILEDAAWDAIAWTEPLAEAARQARAVVFGTLAQRSEASRETVRRLWDAGVPLVYDVNFRPPFVDRETVEAGLAVASFVKLNDHELAEAAAWWGLPEGVEAGARALAERFGAGTVCVTCGAEGAFLLHEGLTYAHPGYPAEVRDTVGAGDAFLAALLAGLFRGDPPEAALDAANRLGALVASHLGALPDYDPADVLAAPPAVLSP